MMPPNDLPLSQVHWLVDFSEETKAQRERACEHPPLGLLRLEPGRCAPGWHVAADLYWYRANVHDTPNRRCYTGFYDEECVTS